MTPTITLVIKEETKILIEHPTVLWCQELIDNLEYIKQILLQEEGDVRLQLPSRVGPAL